MSDFSAAEVLRPRWDPALQGRAVRLFLVLAGGLLGATVLGYGTLAFFRLQNEPLLILLAVVGPLATAGAMLTAAVVIAGVRPIGAIIARVPLLLFLGGVVGTVLLVWGHALLFRFVDNMVVSQDEIALKTTTLFGGPLTLGDIQAHLLRVSSSCDCFAAAEPGGEAGAAAAPDAEPIAPQHGPLAFLAYPLWPIQFQLVRDLLALGGVVGFVSIVAMFGIWWERKVAARMQSRLGPMRVGGWHGWAQSLADGIKLMQKEDIVLSGADKPLFKLAPYLAFVPALSGFIALPFGTYWAFRNLDVALIFILAMLGIEVVGVILAGWASNNKWSVYGAMREACQMVSYEIPMGMSLLIPIMTLGTLNLTLIGDAQGGGFHRWLVFTNPFTFIAALTYFIASLASCKRAPFDLPEAESELVSGYHTEYSGFRFSLFFFAEYAAMFIVSGLAVILFFGAWYSPLPASWGASLAAGPWWQRAIHGVIFSGPIWFIAKSFFFLFVQIWLRWTLPRIRLDQVMYACVQVLLPLTMLVLLGSTVWGILVSPTGTLAVTINVILTLIGAAGVAGFIAIMLYGYSHNRELVGTLAIDHFPGA